MPEIKISGSPEDLIIFSQMEILPIMTFPNDEEMRKKHLATVSAKLGDSFPEMEEKDFLPKERPEGITEEKWEKFAFHVKRLASMESEEIFLKMGGRQTLCNSPEYEKIRERYNLNGYKGLLAGLILHYIWWMNVSDVVSGASVKKAKFLVNELYSDMGDLYSKKYPFNEKFTSKAWSDFKPVSHLWAAFMTWKIWSKPLEYSPFQPQGILKFISLAEKFRQFGITYFPQGQKSPILLSKETWFPSKEFKPLDFKFEIPPPRLAGIRGFTKIPSPNK